MRMELKLALDHSAQFVWHVLRLPIEFFSQRFTGDLTNRISANDRVAQLLARDCGHTRRDVLHRGGASASSCCSTTSPWR